MVPLLEDVFGVSSRPVLSYVRRTAVDDRFLEALNADKQIVVYGSSKQGKTALVQAYLPYEDNLVVRLTPKTEITDIYASVLRQSAIEIEESSTETSGRETSASIKVGFRATIPFFGGANAETGGAAKAEAKTEHQLRNIPFNLALPQDISELLRQANIRKTIILENFHYLDDDRQRQLSFDLRTFQELGIRFIVLGVWREKNRLAQFNGDLVDRVTEVPVEPWIEQDFYQVAEKGEQALNIRMDHGLVSKCANASFSSIGVFQELLREVCIAAGVRHKQPTQVTVSGDQFFDRAARQKADDYATRHQRALEAIAAGYPKASGPRQGIVPLFLPYYLVRVVLESGYDGLANGMRRSVIQERIQSMHHRPDDVRASDMSNLLHNLAALQAEKDISPPIVDYDRSTKMLQVVDSTFYFFLKNADLTSFAEELPNPVAGFREVDPAKRGGDLFSSAEDLPNPLPDLPMKKGVEE
jgi:hypothetical protein